MTDAFEHDETTDTFVCSDCGGIFLSRNRLAQGEAVCCGKCYRAHGGFMFTSTPFYRVHGHDASQRSKKRPRLYRADFFSLADAERHKVELQAKGLVVCITREPRNAPAEPEAAA